MERGESNENDQEDDNRYHDGFDLMKGWWWNYMTIQDEEGLHFVKTLINDQQQRWQYK